MSKTEKLLLGLTLAFLLGFCLLTPRPQRPPHTVTERFVLPAEEPAAEIDSLWIVLETRLDVNAATAEELTALPGIGEVLAGRIVAYREEHGPFVSPGELLAVDGLGPGVLRQLFPDWEFG